jgi:hypothetical protein
VRAGRPAAVRHRRRGRGLNRYDDALEYYRRAHDAYAAGGDRRSQARVHACIAGIHHARGEREETAACRAAAVALLDGMAIGDDDPVWEELRLSED